MGYDPAQLHCVRITNLLIRALYRTLELKLGNEMVSICRLRFPQIYGVCNDIRYVLVQCKNVLVGRYPKNARVTANWVFITPRRRPKYRIQQASNQVISV